MPDPAPAFPEPAIVISEPAHVLYRLGADWLGLRTPAAVLEEVDGFEALCHFRIRALGDPEPRARLVERFHASCDRHGVRVVRSFHGMEDSNPVARRSHTILSDPGRVREHGRLLRSEVSLAAALRRPAGSEIALVIHPGIVWEDDPDRAERTLARALILAAEHAAERRVRLTVETEPLCSWGLRVGQDIRRLVRIVEEVNAWCDHRGLPDVAGITLDLEHSLIAAWGDADRVAEEIERYGGRIDHVHVVAPKDIFERCGPPQTPAWGERVRLFDRAFRPRTANAHRSIAGDERMERLVRLALTRTNWRRIGVINFEVLPPFYYAGYGIRALGRGSTAAGTLASVRRLRRILAEVTSADAGGGAEAFQRA